MWVGKAVIFRWAVVAAIVVAAMIWGYSILRENQDKLAVLPVYGEKNADGSEHRVANFSLVNQDGKTVTQDDFNNKVYVADFIFTTCEGICPLMSNQMERVAGAYKENPKVKILSHTVKPWEDSVSVLKEYAELHHANPSQWNFVTGDLHTINDLAFTSYMVSDTSSEFVHTQFFALVDPERRIRGFYDGTDSTEVKKLIDDIALLLKAED
jgi:protein SCO1/2